MKIKALVFFVFLILTFSLAPVGFADDECEDIEDIAEKVECYEDKVAGLQETERTLQGEIDYIDSQISLTESRIEQSLADIAEKEEEIRELAADITDLAARIDKLKGSIEYQEKVLGERLRERYKSRETSTVMVIFGSSTLNRALQKAEYLTVMEKHDQKLIDEMNSTRDAFKLQKNIFEDTKAQEEILKNQLEVEKQNLDAYNVQLADQRAEKDSLLAATQNDEATYQDLLAEAQRELDQILGAAIVLQGTEPTDVEAGDIIGYQGNTGYSSGDHLHFGVYRYNDITDIDGWNWYYSNTVDPAEVLKSKQVLWQSCENTTKTVGEGDWDWPMRGTFYITNSYGINCYRYTYNLGREHPAYDMAGSYGTPIYAVEDGKAYACRNCLGDGGYGVFIFHDDDYMTLYWHLAAF